MRGRIGWWALAALSAVLLMASVAAGLILAYTAFGDEGLVGVPFRVGLAAMGAGFWWWILSSIRRRLRARDGDDVAEVADVDPIGPWGVVGRVLLGMMLAGFLALFVWVDLVGSRAVERAEAARDEALRLAQDRDLTVADVESARVAELAWAVGGGEGPDPYQQLLPLTEGSVSDVAVDGDRASILIRTDDSPPCAAIDITHGDIIRGRLTDRC